jgi:ribosomal protein L7/L12
MVLMWAPGVIGRNAGWPYVVGFYVLVLLVGALIRMRQIHRRGQTVREALAAARAERRCRAALAERARQDEAALPWLNDKRLSPAEHGVLITPAPDAPAYFNRGHDIVLDSAGNQKIRVIKQVRKLTRLSLKDAKDLVDDAPVPVLRVPDQLMASAAKSILESAGATVSIADPAR